MSKKQRAGRERYSLGAKQKGPDLSLRNLNTAVFFWRRLLGKFLYFIFLTLVIVNIFRLVF